jgi:hypothetical protein
MDPKFLPYTPWPVSDTDALALFENFETALQTRRSLRMYSKKPVSRTMVETSYRFSGFRAFRGKQTALAFCRSAKLGGKEKNT